MPDSYKFMGYAFVAVLILVAGAMIGAVLYETHISKASPDDFWSRWQAIIGSFGVLAAIGVAIYTDLKVDGRFEEQISTQTQLDRRADERQQAEWNRQKREINEGIKEFQKAALNGIIAELEDIYRATEALFGVVQEAKNEGDEYVHGLEVFDVSRPIFQALTPRLTELPDYAFKAVCDCEAKFRTGRRMLEYGLAEGRGFIDQVETTLNMFASFVTDYLEALQNNPSSGKTMTREQVIKKAVMGERGPS